MPRLSGEWAVRLVLMHRSEYPTTATAIAGTGATGEKSSARKADAFRKSLTKYP